MLDKIPRSHFYATAAIIIWAFAYVGTRAVLQFFGALELGFMRNLVAAVFFAVFVSVKKLGLPRWRDWPVFLLCGLLGYALYLLLFNFGIETLSAATSCILIATGPLLTALLASFVFGEKLAPLAWLAMFTAFGGVAVLSLWEGVLTINVGVFWTLGAALSMSAFNVVQRAVSRRPVAVPAEKTALGGILGGYSPIQITAYSFFAAVLLSLPLAPAALAQFARITPVQQLGIVLLGLFPSALSYFCWAKALSIASSTSSVVNYLFLTPFLTLLLGMALLDELPNKGLLIGGALILFGLGLFNLAGRRSKAAARLAQAAGNRATDKQPERIQS